MSILSCNSISLAYGPDVILDNITFSINAGTKLGVIGVNGAGKSTLLKIISGDIVADFGTVSIAKGMTVSRLEQYTDSSFNNKTVADIIFAKFSKLIDTERQLAALENALNTGDETVVKTYTALCDEFKMKGGYEYKSKVMSMLKRLGFNDEDLNKSAAKLSGGQKTKLSLAALLMSAPDIILLDEPTNHLDIEAITWLEDQIRTSSSTFIIVSHDRYFLDKTTTNTLEIENCRSSMYSGSYTVFKEKKKKLREDEAKHYQLQQKEIARLEAFIENQRKWNRERNIIAAESRMKAIDRMEKLCRPESTPKSISITISSDRKGAYDVLSVRNLSKAFGNKELFHSLSFEVKKNDKFFIVGGNGTGKSTLLKIINKVLRADGGVVEFGYNMQPGYYDQEQMLLNDGLDVITELWNAYPDFNHTEMRSALAKYGFCGDDVFKSVRDLSGGEKARLAIAKLVLSGSNLLILDEPTNYLDISSKEVLESALKDYGGTLLCVSHDRYLISTLATKILDIDPIYPDGYNLYTGDYESYIKEKSNFDFTIEKQKKQSHGAAQYQSRKKEISDKRKEEKRKANLEKAVDDIEKRLKHLEKLAEENSTDYLKLSEIEAEKDALNTSLLQFYDDLLEMM